MKKLLGIDVDLKTQNNNLEKILLSLDQSDAFFHIVSLNPETVVIAHHNRQFRKVLSQGDIQLVDGIGILLGCAILDIPAQERIAGVDFMNEIIKLSKNRSLRVLLLGGQGELAEKLALRYQKIYPSSKFKGYFGISNIHNPDKQEEDMIFSIVADYKPQILFVAFGSPYQELWLDKHKDQLKGIICMGVGGSFDFLSGEVKRAPIAIRKIGLEWLFRLILEPWRWKRQMRLIEYMVLVIRQRFGLL